MKRVKSMLALAAVVGLASAIGAQGAVLTHQYTFNNGTAADSVGTANGTLHGSPTVSGGSVTLNGATQWVDLSALSSELGSATDLSFAAWVTWGGGAEWQPIANFSNSQSAWFAFGPSSGTPDKGGAYIDYNAASTSDLTSIATPLASGSPSYVVVTMDSTSHTATLYINGTSEATGTFAGTFGALVGGATGINTLGGADVFGDASFTGSIDQFSIYSGVLSPSDVSADFLAGPVGVPEPAAIGLLGIGALALFVRRRARVALA